MWLSLHRRGARYREAYPCTPNVTVVSALLRRTRSALDRSWLLWHGMALMHEIRHAPSIRARPPADDIPESTRGLSSSSDFGSLC